MRLTVKIPHVYSKITCMGCAAGLPNPDPTETIKPGLGRQITQYHIKWFSLVNSLSFSLHQVNMFMPSTAAPKPCPTVVQKAGPKIWTIFRQKWLKKILTLAFWEVRTCFRVHPQANRLPNKHLALLTVCQFLLRPSCNVCIHIFLYFHARCVEKYLLGGRIGSN